MRIYFLIIVLILIWSHYLVGRDVDSGPVSRADILVTRSQAYTGDSPWALQHLGCGHTGERISLTQRFINTPRLRDGGDIRGESRRLWLC